MSAAALLVIALGGCGGAARQAVAVQAKPASTSAEPAATTGQFIAQASAICRSLKLQRAAIQARLDTTTSAKAAAPLGRQYIADARSADERFAALGSPVQDQVAFRELLNGYSQELADAKVAAEAEADEEQDAAQDATQALQAKGALDERLARTIGLTECTNSTRAGG